MMALVGSGVTLPKMVCPELLGRKAAVLGSPTPVAVEDEAVLVTPGAQSRSKTAETRRLSDHVTTVRDSDSCSGDAPEATACSEQAAFPTSKRRRLHVASMASESARSSMSRWAWCDLRGSPPQPVPAVEEAFATAGSPAAGQYVVCRPSMMDADRLREIERQFVEDHYALFMSEQWTESTTIADWCSVVNVIEGEALALKAIRGIVRGDPVGGTSNPHMTLQCVFLPAASGPGGEERRPEIVGYVHFVMMRSYVDISHLKVSRAHRHLGLGALLLAGMARYAERVRGKPSGKAHGVTDLKLVVMSRNEGAIHLYKSLGFKSGEVVTKRVKGGLAKIEWTKMGCTATRAQQAGFLKRFLDRCHERSARALAQERV